MTHMTQAIETLCRRLDAANCVYELRMVAAGSIRIDTYRVSFYETAYPIAATVELEFGSLFEIDTYLTMQFPHRAAVPAA